MRPLQLWLSNLTGTLALPEVQYNSSPEVIRLAVMMHIRYPLSLRQIEDLLFERGIDICHETVRFWWSRFGPVFAAEIRKRRVHHTISGAPWITRARCLRFFATKRRDRRAELKLLKRTMKRYGQAKAIVTDRLRSYRAAMKVIGIVERQECGRWLNNRAENSVSTKRACDGEVQGHKDPAEVRLRPCLDPQPFQPGAPPQPPGHLQAEPLRREKGADPIPHWPSMRLQQNLSVSVTTIGLGILSVVEMEKFVRLVPVRAGFRTMASVK